MKIDSIDIEATIKKAQSLIREDKQLSAGAKSMFEILIFSILMMLFILVFGGLIETGLVDHYISGLQEQIIAGKERFSNSIGEEAYSKTLEILPSTTIYDLALDYFLKSWPLGLFLIIVITLILRKKT